MEPSGSAQLCCLLAVTGHAELFLRQIEGLHHKQLARLGSTSGRREIAEGCSGIPLPQSHPLLSPLRREMVWCTTKVTCCSQTEGTVSTPAVPKASWWQLQLPPPCQPRTSSPYTLSAQRDLVPHDPHLGSVGGHPELLLVHPGHASQGVFMVRLQRGKNASLCLHEENTGGHQLPQDSSGPEQPLPVADGCLGPGELSLYKSCHRSKYRVYSRIC